MKLNNESETLFISHYENILMSRVDFL